MAQLFICSETSIKWPPIGESLFIILVSLAEAIQFLMELQINQFRILKGHSTINSANESMSLM